MKHFCSIALLLVSLIVPTCTSAANKPNIVFLIADDLGYGDVGCYGQQKIRTPNIDQLAKDGMRFTAHYAGSNVCAPSRCSLLTGLHTGHTYIRENRQAKGYSEGQVPVPASYLQLPLILKQQGYTIGGFGKWGLGPVGSSGDPLKQGFARFFGYNCQAVAHNYYPTHLWDNDKQIALDNPEFEAHQKFPANADAYDPASYTRYVGTTYAPDLFTEQALKFVRESKDQPFVLHYATTVPHLALQVPEDSLAQYAGKFPETPYLGDQLYLPNRRPRATYAAMVTRMDRDMGRILALIRELALDEKTIVIFVSDNGPLYDKLGGTDADFFNSAAGFRGRKGSYYEGGFRVPCIVRWLSHVQPNTTSDRVTGFEDWLPTLLELIGSTDLTPKNIDGISFAPTLLGQGDQPARAFLYRESPGYGGQQCVRVGDFKAIRTNLNPAPPVKDQTPGNVELYGLKNDPFETKDIAADHPDVVARLSAIMTQQHVKSKQFPMRALDGASNGNPVIDGEK